MSATSRSSAAPLGDVELYLDLYRRMRLIRGFEDLVQSLFLRNEIYGTTHLYSGQEAVAVGFASVLGEQDRVAATYRGHGHALALGVDPQKLLDEMLGRATGINGGLAGSMNVTSPPDRLIGCFGIVGGSIAAATGAGLALRGDGRRGGRVLRRRRHEPGLLLRVPELLPGAAAAGRARLREQRLRRVHGLRGGHGRGDPGARRGDGGAGRDDRRHERVDGSRGRRARARARALRRRPVLRRGDHLPLRRALAQRPRQVPARRASSTAGASATRSSCSARGWSRKAWWRSALDELEASVEAQLAEHEERGLAAPFPEPRAFSEFKELSVAQELTMPKLSDSMEEATILRWLKAPGEPFAKGEPLVEVETDKATIVYEAETDGVLASVLVAEGGTARSARRSRRSTWAAARRRLPRQPRQRRPGGGDTGSTSAPRSATRSTRRSRPTSG